MKDQRKAEEIAAERVQLLSPLLAEGLDAAQAREIKDQICEQAGISERTVRRYLTQYQVEGFAGLKPKDRSQSPERGRHSARDPGPGHPAAPSGAPPQRRPDHSDPGVGRACPAGTDQAQHPAG